MSLCPFLPSGMCMVVSESVCDSLLVYIRVECCVWACMFFVCLSECVWLCVCLHVSMNGYLGLKLGLNF